MPSAVDWSTLTRALERFEHMRVLVVGDVMLDRTLAGSISRISPEAPVPILQVQEERSTPGGAANVALNLSELGAKVSLLGVVGADAAGRELRSLVAARGIGADGLLTSSERPTTLKQRLVAQRQQLLRYDIERAHPLPALLERELLAVLREQLANADALIVSDYAKGTLSDSLLAQLAALAGDRITVVDPKSSQLGRYRGHRYVTPNRSEFKAAFGLDIDDDATLLREVCPRVRELGLDRLVVTCGDRGVVLVSGQDVARISGHPVEVFDVVGAGDTFIATFTLARAVGLPVEESARVANVAGSIVVGKVGTAQVRNAELRARLASELSHPLRLAAREHKRMDRKAAQVLAQEARSRGRRVVFTNGCFDVLHPGHLKLLTEARILGDLLIVGLNSDASVQRLKGESRPVISQEDRATLLCAYDFVDAVVLFEDDTPLALIEAVLPDVLVKGGDYANGHVVGRELVEARGGRVVLIDVLAGRSTSEIVARVRRVEASPRA